MIRGYIYLCQIKPLKTADIKQLENTQMQRKSLKEIAQEVRTQLKKEFPNCKFSVMTEYYSMGQSLYVRLMSAPFAAFAKSTDVNGYERRRDYCQLNEYTLRGREPEELVCNGEYLTREAWDVMKRAEEIGNANNWNNSDSMTDYYDVNYAFHIGIGKWDKAFVNTAPPTIEPEPEPTPEPKPAFEIKKPFYMIVHVTTPAGRRTLNTQIVWAENPKLAIERAIEIAEPGVVVRKVYAQPGGLDAPDVVVGSWEVGKEAQLSEVIA